MYIVMESQTNSEGVVSTIVNQYENLNAADNKYYTILAAAAISNLPLHSAFILTDAGQLVKSYGYSNISQPHEGE